MPETTKSGRGLMALNAPSITNATQSEDYRCGVCWRAVAKLHRKQPQWLVHRLAMARSRPVVLRCDDERLANRIQRALSASKPGASTPSSFVIRICMFCPCGVALRNDVVSRLYHKHAEPVRRTWEVRRTARCNQTAMHLQPICKAWRVQFVLCSSYMN